MTVRAYIAAALLAASLASPALAQGSTDLDNVTAPAPIGGTIVTAWTVQAFVDNVPGIRRDASSPAAARTAAQAACAELRDAPTCLALLKARSLASLTAQGPNNATYFLDLETNLAGGRKSYVAIFALREVK